MKVIHLLLPDATRWDRASAAIDATAQSGIEHELVVAAGNGWLRDGRETSNKALNAALRPGETSLLHVHGVTQPPRAILRDLAIPWIANRPVPLPRSLFRRIPRPAAVLIARGVPEAAEDDWFDAGDRRHDIRSERKQIGSLVRCAETRNSAEQVFARILRFREDVDWTLFEQPPSPAELAGLDLWVDPATRENDLDGMVVEAIACLTPVVASKTSVNERRLDGGSAGLLAPAADHNEMTHAVLNLLFKEEVAAPRRLQASRIRDRFRPDRRHDVVLRIYREVCG